MFKKLPLKVLLTSTLLTLFSSLSHATVVEIRTSLGNVQVNLFDNATPKTVANFLSYVNSGAYVNNVVHRVDRGFVVQAGGFKYTGPVQIDGGFTLDNVATGTNVVNEPKLSNVRGTIAMAKGSSPDSAKSQWFINLSDNASNLDIAANSGGFTVFGQVLGDGMQVIDTIAGLSIIQYAIPFNQLPIRNYTQNDVDNKVAITDDNLVVISDVVVIDSAVATHPEIVPANNTLINNSNNGGSGSDSGSGGGGTFAWLSVLAFGLLISRLRR